MRKLFLPITILLSVHVLAQNKDSLLQVFPTVKGETERFRRIWQILDNPDPQKGLQYHQQLLAITRKQGDKAGEAYVTALIGWAELLAGNTATGTDIAFKALRMAEEAGSEQALGAVYLMLGFPFLSNDPPKAKAYLDKALAASTGANDHQFVCYELRAIASYYEAQGKADSALYFHQRCMEVVTAHKLVQDMPTALVGVGKINYKLGRKALALQYYREALHEPYIISGDPKENADDKAVIYGAFSDFYRSEGMLDSALYYARMRYQTVKAISFRYQMGAANSLWKAFEKINGDSALKYATQYHLMKDSIYSAGKLQQMQALALLEDARQQKSAEERKHNLQYAAIALGLVTLLIAFLMLSHSVIANQRLIKFFGILALLIVFEFLNLLLHPMLDRITNHQPVLMLLAMVCIAALLIPLHHKLEHWITHRLVEKNNKIRLAAAKKTIATLEGEQLNNCT